MEHLVMERSAQESLKLLVQMGLVSRKQAKKVLQMMHKGLSLSMDDPMAEVFRMVWMVQLKPANNLIH